MLGSAALAGAALCPQDERNGQLTAGHEMRLRRLVDELIESERQEVDEHDLDDGTQARLRRADRDAADGRLADRRVADALGAELLRESCGRSPGPAFGHVLAQDEHARVGAHRLPERRRDRLQIRGLCHQA